MRTYIYCDSCGKETLHEIVREDRNLYRCIECNSHVLFSPEKEIKLRAIISSGARSRRGTLKVRRGDVIEIGDEYIVDTGEGHRIGEVTAIELRDGRRVERGYVQDISTVWLRDVGEVEVRISLHKRSVTTPYRIVTDGDMEFEVGEVLDIDGKLYRIHRIKISKGGVARNPGERVKARDIRRIYAKYEGKKY
jgi:uncharacterized Zn finger protein